MSGQVTESINFSKEELVVWNKKQNTETAVLVLKTVCSNSEKFNHRINRCQQVWNYSYQLSERNKNLRSRMHQLFFPPAERNLMWEGNIMYDVWAVSSCTEELVVLWQLKKATAWCQLFPPATHCVVRTQKNDSLCCESTKKRTRTYGKKICPSPHFSPDRGIGIFFFHA